MIKKVSIALSSLVFATTINATELSVADAFIGIEAGAAEITGHTLTEAKHKGDDVEFGFRIGAQKDDWRTMLVFDYFDSEDDAQTYKKGLVELDYFLFSSEANSVSLSPFIGLNGGYMHYKTPGMDASNGFIYGGQAGFVVGVADTIDVDLMYRYSFSDADQTLRVKGFVLGFNYNY